MFKDNTLIFYVIHTSNATDTGKLEVGEINHLSRCTAYSHQTAMFKNNGTPVLCDTSALSLFDICYPHKHFTTIKAAKNLFKLRAN